MVKESPLNFFHSSEKKKKNIETPETLAQIKKAPPELPAPPFIPGEKNPAIKQMLDRMTQMSREIDDKIEELTRKHGLSQETIRKYLTNSNNFSKEQWEFLQQKNNDFVQKIWSTIEPVVGESSNVDTIVTAGTEEPAPKVSSKKGKFVGSRRKWIPTR